MNSSKHTLSSLKCKRKTSFAKGIGGRCLLGCLWWAYDDELVRVDEWQKGWVSKRCVSMYKRSLRNNLRPSGHLDSSILNVEDCVVESLHECAIGHGWNVEVFVLLCVWIAIEDAANRWHNTRSAGAKDLLYLHKWWVEQITRQLQLLTLFSKMARLTSSIVGYRSVTLTSPHPWQSARSASLVTPIKKIWLEKKLNPSRH